MKPKINIIVCTDQNNGIGKNGDMPWDMGFKEDLKRFKKITMGSPVIMGRKTHQSIGKFLEGRPNCVISSARPDNSHYLTARCLHSENIKQALSWIGYENIFIIGGESIYQQTIDIADAIYLTKIDKEYECDKFFPAIDPKKWSVDGNIEIGKNKDFYYSFRKLVRK